MVDDVNLGFLENHSELYQLLENTDELTRLKIERHGAIRVGKAEELVTLKRIFEIMGMYPVGYYDLSQASVPVHSTAFRPIEDSALIRNPFRVFTSLLRPELIADQRLRDKAVAILMQRDIFTPGCRALLDIHDQQSGFSATQVNAFIAQVLETFRWHQQATVDSQTYHDFHNAHRLIADIVCFRGCHINHLTPRTLDIDRVQSLMSEYGMTPKAIIEVPPRREVPILLRQTSFKALEERVLFSDHQHSTHTARFGEVEQRGIALTPKGRALYDHLLQEAGQGIDNFHHQQHLCQVFNRFPDCYSLLREQGLAYFRYRLTPMGENHRQDITPTGIVQTLIERGWLLANLIIYEDFLPISAVGIFHSNLKSKETQWRPSEGNRDVFEQALGTLVIDEFSLYQHAEDTSKRRCGLL